MNRYQKYGREVEPTMRIFFETLSEKGHRKQTDVSREFFLIVEPRTADDPMQEKLYRTDLRLAEIPEKIYRSSTITSSLSGITPQSHSLNNSKAVVQ